MDDAPIRVLLVEDDEEDYLITKELLWSSQGLETEVVWAERLEDGLRRLKQEKFDVVLLDLTLSDSVGWNTFERTRDHAPDVPTILLTGISDESLGMQAVQRGAQDYLLKGCIDSDRLARAIRYSIERKRTERSLRRYQDHLEDLVAARTAELSQTNEKLSTEIAERTAVEAQLREAIRLLEAHDRAKTEFVSNVSHELKTPLSSMSYAIDNMIRGVIGPIPERVMTYLHMLKEDSERLKGTISDILDLSRVEADTLVLNRHRLSFARLVAQTAGSLRIQAEAQRHRLDVSVGEGQGFVDADPHKLARVILNIIQNAIKYTPEGGCIEVTLHRNATDEGLIALDVIDTGIGIQSQHIGRVTERYFRVGEHVTGTGLGLALAKEIVQMHGGQISLESPPRGRSGGTCVTLNLPLVPPPMVLIVTPQEDVVRSLVEGLRRHGYDVTCRNDHEAREVTGELRADIVLIDLCAPGLAGMDTVAALRADETTRQTPVLALVHENPEPPKAAILDELGLQRLACEWDEDVIMNRLENALVNRPEG